MTTITDQATINAIQTAYNTQGWQAAYQLVFDAISTVTTVQDPNSGAILESVAPTNPDDQAAWIWIGGAKNVNANSGAFASYIRNYTAEQYLLRTGQNIPGGVGTDPDGLIQAASDKIAQRFVASLFGKLDDPNGNPEAVIDGEFTSLTLPDLDTIGRIDAGAAASGIFASTSPDGMKNYSPWAGTLLFTRLNDPSFFQNWVLTKDANTFKKETGTYDLATIAKTTRDVGGIGNALQAVLAGELPTFFQVSALGAPAVATESAAATAFFNQTYGLTDSAIDVGADIFSLGILPNSARYIVGTTGDDAALVSIDGSEFLNAGRGDDTIKGAYDSAAFGNIAVIDGGDGVDTVDYSDLNVATTVKFEMVGELGVRIAVQKNPDSVGDTDYLYQIEKLVLGGGADTVKIRAGVDLSKIKSIDGGDQPADDKDVLDFSEFDRKVDIGGSSIGGSDRFAVDDSGVTGAGTTFKNFEKLILSDQDDTIKVRSLADLGGLKEIDAGGSPAGTSDVFDLSPSSAGFIFSDNKLSGNDLTIKLDNFEKIIGSTGNDTIDLTMSSITKADGGAGDDIIIGGETRSILLGGDGTDLLVAGSGGSVLDGGVSDGEGDAYIGGAGADTFVIGNGTHGKQGTDALFHISNAGANDRLVLRLDDTVGFGDGSSWMKGIVLNGGVYVVDPGVPPDNSGFIGATFSSALADMTGWDIGPRGSDFGRVSSIEPVSLRPSIGNFIAEYDWDQIDSTLVISIATAYGDFQVDIDDFQSGQLGLNFVSSPPPRPTGLPTVEAGIFTKASWDAYKTKMSAFVNSAQIVDLPSPGDPARGDAAPVLPAYDLEILPSYDSVFNPEEGATVGSNPGSVTPPTQPPGPVTAEALLAQNNISQFVQAMASYSATGAGSSSIQASFIDSNLQTTLAASLHA